MSSQQDDLLASLQSSMRNTLATFGPDSPQYISLKYVVDEHIAKAALRNLDLGSRKVSGHVMNLALRPRAA